MKKRKIALTAVVFVTAAILLSETQTGIAYAVEGWESLVLPGFGRTNGKGPFY